MQARSRGLMSALAVAALTVPILSGASAGASSAGPNHASVDILGGNHFTHPGFLTNDYRFPSEPTVIKQGGTITFNNMTHDFHTMALVTAGAVPKNTSQVDNCVVCNSINTVFGLNNPGPPNGFQIDNGVIGDDAKPDADLVDPAAPPNSKPPILTEDFDTPSHGSTVGDATVIAFTGAGFQTQRTIVLTAAPGLYHYICTIHAWMQGEIQVVK
jgi:plastocyanin